VEFADRNGRTVKLPFAFGDIVYHRSRADKVPGMVTGYTVRERGVLPLIMWSDNLCEGQHNFYELTTEFEASPL
jgi:hypothetical protein